MGRVNGGVGGRRLGAYAPSALGACACASTSVKALADERSDGRVNAVEVPLAGKLRKRR